MNECYGNKFILNGELVSSEIFSNSLIYEGESVYEVIRMVKGSPVFFDDHMARLLNSLKIQKKKLLADQSEIRRSIISLARSGKKKAVNLKIVFNYNNNSANYLVYFLEPVYPGELQYRNGVKGLFFSAERKDPVSKVINHKLRSAIYHKLILEGAYEAILVDANNYMTEGSRTNIFFIKGDQLVTAPDDAVLNGITRKHIIDICNENNISLDLKLVSLKDIDTYDAIFMTGTSPVVLPFNTVDEHVFEVNLPVIRQLRDLYLVRSEESLRKFRSE